MSVSDETGMPLKQTRRSTLRLPLQAGDVPLRRGGIALVVIFGSAAASIAAWGDTTTAYLVVCAVGYIAVLIWALGLSRRASDAAIDADGITVEGGPYDGRSFLWDEIDCGASRIGRADLDPREHLWVAMRDGREFPIAAATGDKGVESLHVLRDVIAASPAWRSGVAVADRRGSPERARTAILTCDACGAQLRPVDDGRPCPYCAAAVTVPAELRARIAETRRALTLRSETDALVERLLALPSARRTNVLVLAASLWMLVAVPFAVFSFDSEPNRAAVAAGLCVLAFLFLYARIIDRFALRVVLVAFAATAPLRAGDPERCRRCDGPLPDETRAICRCVYCGADNVLGIDLGIQRDLGQAHDELEPALEFRERHRRVLKALLGATVLAVGATVAFVRAR